MVQFSSFVTRQYATEVNEGAGKEGGRDKGTEGAPDTVKYLVVFLFAAFCLERKVDVTVTFTSCSSKK